MMLAQAKAIAERVVAELAPHCEKVVIAGSILREKPEPNDIEIVAIAKPYDPSPLFCSGVALVVNRWPAVRGELPCKYTRRKLPDGIDLDLFFATPENFGYILAIRTGPAGYSHNVLARGWASRGFHGEDGMLVNSFGRTVPVPDERTLFKLAGVEWVEPRLWVWNGPAEAPDGY